MPPDALQRMTSFLDEPGCVPVESASAQAPAVSGLRQEIDELLALLAPQVPANAVRREGAALSVGLGKWLDRRANAAATLEPARTVHHFACTGGTLISKCLAALPNVQLLSEVDPLSPNGFRKDQPRFAPTDMITLLRQSTRDVGQDVLISIFHGELRLVHERVTRLGQRLIVRDHAHSHFCQGRAVPARPSLRELVSALLPVRSLVTVRHPLDSYAALVTNKWCQFEPQTLDEYCVRYLSFLDRYDGVAIERYEDFTADPEATMRRMCDVLALPYSPYFAELYPVFRISGDSGRSADVIEHRPSRPIVTGMFEEARRSQACMDLLARLKYPLGDHPVGGVGAGS